MRLEANFSARLDVILNTTASKENFLVRLDAIFIYNRIQMQMTKIFQRALMRFFLQPRPDAAKENFKRV